MLTRVLAAAAFVAATVAGAGSAVAAGGDGRIGVYADLTATQTQATFSLGVARTLYIVATLEGQTAGGMTAGEFRVTGLPADWLVFASPNPLANVVLGDPFRTQGGVHRAIMAFPACQFGMQQRVLLYTAVVVATSLAPAGDLRVEGGLPPSNANFPMPVLTRCDAPDFTKVAVEGGALQFDLRAPQDLYYSEQPGYDGQRGVKPIRGFPGDLFRFRVVYAAANNQAPQAGSPRLELDANGDGDALDAGEGAFTMSPADLDSSLIDGKAYRYDVALGEPPGGRYRYRFSATDAGGMPVGGLATAWLDSLFVSATLPNLTVRAEGIRLLPPNPPVGARFSIAVPIENRSDVRADNVRVRVETMLGALIIERVLDVIGPRATTEIAVNGTFGEFGFQPVVVRVDHLNAIAETDETDNVASQGVLVGGAGLAGRFQIALPPLASLPPVAPFALRGDVKYVWGVFPRTAVRNARVTVRPSWQASFASRTDNEGGFAADLVAPAVPGPYQVKFVVTDGAHTDSASVNVQVTPLAGQLPPHAPNLVPHLDVTLDAGCPAATASVSWSVENRGDRDSAPTLVRLLAGGVTEVAQVAVGVVPPGMTVTLGPIQVPLAGASVHSYTMHVDPAAALRELREDDNAASASVRVPVGCLDLAVDRVRFTGTRFCTDPAIDIAVQVANRGCTPSAATRVACFDGLGELASAALGALAPGQLLELQFELPLARFCHELRFEVDPESAVGTDCDPAGDVLSADICIDECEPPPLPDLPNFRVTECDIAVSNTRPTVGELVEFRATIRNAGPGVATAPVLVRFLLDGVLVGGQAVPVSVNAVGATALVTAPVSWPADFVVHTLRVELDANGQMEFATFDNAANRGLPFDLRLMSIAACPPVSPAMFSTCNPCRFDGVRIEAFVENIGLFDCESARVDFVDETDGNRLLGSAVALDVLGAGSTCPLFARSVVVPAEFEDAGVHVIAVIVDPAGVVSETDEMNNRLARSLTVDACFAGGDLVAEVQLPGGTDPQPRETISSVEVRVRNVGTSPALSVQARLRLDGTTLCDLEYGDLQAGQSELRVCTTPWVVDSTGCQVLVACADPNNRVGEPDESNNCAMLSVSQTTTDLAILPELIRITPSNPSVGQQTFVEVGLYNFDGVQATCRFEAEFELFPDFWVQMANVPLVLPAGQGFIPNAVSFVFTPPVTPAGLRFTLHDICPPDREPLNNQVLGSLPWFEGPGTPILVQDLEASSHPDGIHIVWRAEPGAVSFAFDRRSGDGAAAWRRLPATIPATAAGRYEFVDRDAEPGARLEYRLVGRLTNGDEEVLATFFVTHGAATMALQLYPVRPQPFRPGGTFELSLPQAGTIDLCVYDAAGRRVRILERGRQAAGRHAVPWDCRDDAGRPVPNGVYFCRFASAAFEQTRRVVIVR